MIKLDAILFDLKEALDDLIHEMKVMQEEIELIKKNLNK